MNEKISTASFMDSDTKKMRKAELISPPNRLKEKVGSGGLDETIINKAQIMLENNTVDFQPIANMLIEVLDEAIHDAKSGNRNGEEAIEALIYPAMQLKAQGGMFHYQLITEISNILVNFLEVITQIDKDVLDIVVGHRMAIRAVLSGKIKGDGGQTGKELRDALMDACNRYYRAHSE